jgi:hypothetical protein
MRTAAVTGAGALAVLLAPLLLIGALLGGIASTASARTVNIAAIPPLAAQLLNEITATTASSCPELPPVWVIAEVDAESGWNPTAFSADRNGGAAGLYQLNQANWRAAGGRPWAGTPPPPDADIYRPDEHLRLAIPWICRNLRTTTAHLTATGKPTPPLDAMLVCHIAGCDRVTGSRTGIPAAGEAGCDPACVSLVTSYIDRVHALVARYTAAAGPVPVGDLPAPDPYRGPTGGCTEADPTGGRCLTPVTRHAYDEIIRAFGQPGPGRLIRSASCWDAHAWNPASDHPRGRACDFFPTVPGRFAQGEDLVNGWHLATWLRAHADALNISYLIWQGRFWSPATPDADGTWGQPYTGGGVYDVRDATGGHFDHVHVSFRE